MPNTTEKLKQAAISMAREDEDKYPEMLEDARQIKNQVDFVRWCQDWGWDAEACENFMKRKGARITTEARLLLEDEGAEGSWDT